MGTHRTTVDAPRAAVKPVRGGVRAARPHAARVNRPRAALLALAVALLTACGGGPAEPGAEETGAAAPEETPTEPATSAPPQTDETTDDATAPPAEEPAVITIVDYEYQVPETVEPGATVLVRNEDPVTHTVTSDEEGVFDVEVPGGEEVEMTVPEEAGEYPFYCVPHPYMTSTLVVG